MISRLSVRQHAVTLCILIGRLALSFDKDYLSNPKK